MYLKKHIKDFLPPIVQRLLMGLFYGWSGNYLNWEDARQNSTGYDSQAILDKVKDSSLKVKSGIAVYERDSMTFTEIQYNYPLISGLLWVGTQNNRSLNILDFGGSLGSAYFQNYRLLDSLNEIKWCIVEQPDFVKVGKELFSNNKLFFYSTIEECLAEVNIDVILLSSVLPYIEKPFELLEKIIKRKVKFIFIDRTPFISGKDRITIQKVNPRLYKASYPCWFFNKSKFIDYMKKEYDLIFEFNTPDRANINSEFKGFLFRLRQEHLIDVK